MGRKCTENQESEKDRKRKHKQHRNPPKQASRSTSRPWYWSTNGPLARAATTW